MLNKYLEQVNKEEVKLWINTVLKNYLKKNEENVGEIEHILDFLGSDKAPSRLKKMSYIQAKASTDKWVKSLNKKASNIVEEKDDTKTIIKWKDGMRLVRLVGENSFKREGLLMSHCVGSYYGKKEVKVYSLRDSKNNPHCTIEVTKEKNVINQIKGKGNGKIHPNYIKYVLKTLKKVFKMDVRESEMNNLGYSLPPEGYIKFLEENGIKVFTLKVKDSLYVYSK